MVEVDGIRPYSVPDSLRTPDGADIVKIKFKMTQFYMLLVFGVILIPLIAIVFLNVNFQESPEIVVAGLICFVMSVSAFLFSGLFIAKNRRRSKDEYEILMSRDGMLIQRFDLYVPWRDVSSIRSLRAPGVHQVQIWINDSGRANIKPHAGKKYYGSVNIDKSGIAINLKWLNISKRAFYDALQEFSQLRIR